MDPLVQSGQVTITHSSKGVTIDIRDTALFPTGQAQPNDQSRLLMANMALQLAKVDNPIRVEGFTDTVPIRNSYFPSNWELSLRAPAAWCACSRKTASSRNGWWRWAAAPTCR